HIDLKRIAMDQKLKVNVPIELVGEPAGVKQQGGILEQIAREVEVECLPGDIPHAIELSVSELVFGTVLRISDLPKNDKVKYLSDPEQPGEHIIKIKEEEVPAAETIASEAVDDQDVADVFKKGIR